MDENHSVNLLLCAPNTQCCNECNHQLASKSIKPINCARFSTAHSPPRLALLTSCKLFQMLFSRLHRPLVRTSPLWRLSRPRYILQGSSDPRPPGPAAILTILATLIVGETFLSTLFQLPAPKICDVYRPDCTESCRESGYSCGHKVSFIYYTF